MGWREPNDGTLSSFAEGAPSASAGTRMIRTSRRVTRTTRSADCRGGDAGGAYAMDRGLYERCNSGGYACALPTAAATEQATTR